MAVLALTFFFLEGVGPWIVAAVGALEHLLAREGGRVALFTLQETLFSFFILALTLLVRGAVDLRLRLGLLSALLHPAWVACLTWIFARSVFINGVLHRNTWRGRVRDARTLQT